MSYHCHVYHWVWLPCLFSNRKAAKTHWTISFGDIWLRQIVKTENMENTLLETENMNIQNISTSAPEFLGGMLTANWERHSGVQSLPGVANFNTNIFLNKWSEFISNFNIEIVFNRCKWKFDILHYGKYFSSVLR